jgi:hypothetical protein
MAFARTIVRFAETSGIQVGGVSFATIVATSVGIVGI